MQVLTISGAPQTKGKGRALASVKRITARRREARGYCGAGSLQMPSCDFQGTICQTDLWNFRAYLPFTRVQSCSISCHSRPRTTSPQVRDFRSRRRHLLSSPCASVPRRFEGQVKTSDQGTAGQQSGWSQPCWIRGCQPLTQASKNLDLGRIRSAGSWGKGSRVLKAGAKYVRGPQVCVVTGAVQARSDERQHFS